MRGDFKRRPAHYGRGDDHVFRKGSKIIDKIGAEISLPALAVKTFPALGKNIGGHPHPFSKPFHIPSCSHDIASEFVAEDERRWEFGMSPQVSLRISTAGCRRSHLHKQFALCWLWDWYRAHQFSQAKI
jgi:hypothetical protein